MGSELSISQEIKKYWSQEATGALFIKLSNQRLLQVFFINGRIRSLKYHGMTGMAVLNTIPELTALKSQFHPGATSKLSNELPTTADIINMLDGSKGRRNGKAVNGFSSKPTAEQQAYIEGVFTHYVGPIADMVFSDCANKADSIDKLISELSNQISDVDEQDNFKEEIETGLRSIL